MTTQELLNKIAQLPERPRDTKAAPPAEVVAFVVRWERSLRQWKVSTLADFARVSTSSVERIERGEKVSDEVLDRIAQAFGHEPGHFTNARIPRGINEATASLVETYGHLESVTVAPMKTQRAIREAARCDALLLHQPGVPETYDVDVENLREWLDLASFVLSDSVGNAPRSERGRRDLYNAVLMHIREMERRGLTVLSGVMPAPQNELRDWKVAIVAVSPKLRDPGAVKRRCIFVDRRLVAFQCNGSEA